MTPDDTDHTASDNTIRGADGHAGRLRWPRRARQPWWPSPKVRPNWPPLRWRVGGDEGTRLARLTARQFRHAPGASGSVPRFLVAHALWILVVTFAAVAAAGAFAHSQRPYYKSAAVVSVQPAPVAAGSGNPPNMATEEGIVSSGAVLAKAAAALGVPRAVLAKGLSVSVPGTTTLLQITYTDPVPRVAQQRAQAIAEAYVSYRSSRSARGTKPATPGVTPTAILVTPASMPTSPAGPKYLIDIAAALIVGLAAGVGTAALRDYMDDGLRGPLDLESQAGAPVLALIPAFRPGRRDPGGRLVVVAYPRSLAAEAYRGLRTRLVEAATPGHAKTLLVTSPGWEGKSTVAANLAAALAQSGRSVVLVSADMRWGRVHELFGLGTGPGLSMLLEGRASLAEALQPTQVPGLRLLPPGTPPPDPAALLQSPAWHIALGDIRSRADVAVIDAPPMLASPDVRALAERAEMILVVADERRSARAQVRLAMREVEHVRGKLAGCVLDNVGRRRWLRSRSPEPLADGRARGEVRAAPGRRAEALADFTPAIDPGPHPAGVNGSRGQADAGTGRGDDAPTDYTQVIDIGPDDARAMRSRGRAHQAMDRHEEALADFTRAIELDLSHAMAIGSRDQAHGAMVRSGEAPADDTRAIDLEPNLARAIAGRGETNAAMGRHEEALADFTRAIELDPRDSWAIGSRGQAYQAMARHEEALADFSRAIGLDPSLAWAIAGRGEAYAAMGRHEEALADFTRAVQLDPRDSWAIASRAQACYAMGRHEEALADFSRAIGLDPSLAWAIAGRGETYRLMGRHEEALADFTRAVDLDPVYAWAIGSRAQVYLAMGQREDALADFSRAIDLDPGLTWVIAGRGETYTAMSRHKEALADFTRAIDLDPLDAWAIGRRGQACLALGRHEEALADLSQAIDLNPELAWAISSRAQVHEAMGRPEEAQADRGRATDADPDPGIEAGGDSPPPAEPHGDHQEAERRPEEELTPSAVNAVDHE
jgi:capsular exopolysaccharide synthesis family protein